MVAERVDGRARCADLVRGGPGSVDVVESGLHDDGLFELDQPASPARFGAGGTAARTDAAEGASAQDRVWANAPLAVRMRPRSLAEVVGQDHLLAPGAPLRRLVEGAAPASILLYWPPGTGKPALAPLACP